MAPPPPVHPDMTPAEAKPEAAATQPTIAAAPDKAAPAPVAPPAAAAAAKAAPAPSPAAAPKAAPSPATVAKAAPAPPPAAAPKASSPPPLDLRSLEERLKDTDAIGVLTKLSLKNQVDDLVTRFREYHAGKRPPTLAELRQPFELLLMKVLSLLQEKDTALARDINASREAIWSVLSDRDKLAQFT